MQPQKVKGQGCQWVYIFGAFCPPDHTGVAIGLTQVSVTAMKLLLEEVDSKLPLGMHAAMLLDKAGWHIANAPRIPPNMPLRNLPPCSPEPNAIEKGGQHLQDGYVQGGFFNGPRAIVDACCTVWNKRSADTGRIQCLTDFAWARPVHPQSARMSVSAAVVPSASASASRPARSLARGLHAEQRSRASSRMRGTVR